MSLSYNNACSKLTTETFMREHGIDKLIKLKSCSVTYPTSNAKLLACDTTNEHSLERLSAAVRQLSNGTNFDNIYKRKATAVNAIQTVNSPM